MSARAVDASAAAGSARERRPGRAARLRPIPGFAPSIALTTAMCALLVVLPLSALALAVARAPVDTIVRAATDARTLASMALSFVASGLAALLAVPIGVAIAWVLARYELPGRRVLDAIVDVPFALPTAVSGIALAALTSPEGWVGALVAPFGVRIAFTRAGVALALLFTSLPFVVRTVQPVIEDLPLDVEEAASSLGASRAQTFLRVILPSIAPAIVAGATLAFARALGEYGSVVFIAGNMPMRTEIAPLRILSHLESYDYASAAVVAASMSIASAALLLIVNAAQRRMVRA